MKKIMFYLILLLTLIGPTIVAIFGHVNLTINWSNADRSSAKIATDPKQFRQAVVQFYAARAYGFRGLLAVHTWIAVKPDNAQQYTVYQVVGWNLFYGKDVLSISQDIPDRLWFENKPWLIKDIRGDEATKIIPVIEQVVATYPYKKNYRIFPGPNSNTFIAYVARNIPSLKLAMPAEAIGTDFLGNSFFSRTPSGTGYQLSIYGLFGLSCAKQEGIIISLLGLTYGINPWRFDLILPGIGSVRDFAKF
jgi:hypothetical protein